MPALKTNEMFQTQNDPAGGSHTRLKVNCDHNDFDVDLDVNVNGNGNVDVDCSA